MKKSSTCVRPCQDQPPKTSHDLLGEAWEIVQPPPWVFDRVAAVKETVGPRAALTQEFYLATLFLMHEVKTLRRAV